MGRSRVSSMRLRKAVVPAGAFCSCRLPAPAHTAHLSACHTLSWIARCQVAEPASTSNDGAPSSSGASTAEPPADPMEATIQSPKQNAKLTLEQYKEIYDRLIKIFQERPRDDWKKLIVFSRQWPEHSKGVFER